MSNKKDNQSLDALEQKLKNFESRLRILLESTESDLKIAAALQKHLMPNKVPQVPGLLCYAKYICAGELSSESFDIIPTKNGRELWFVNSWTESFGLSSVLLQALVHLQSEAIVKAHTNLDVAQAFNDLSLSLTGAKRTGNYRLLLAKIDLLSLRVTGYAAGCIPLLMKVREKNVYGPWQWVQKASFGGENEIPESVSSANPMLANKASAFSFILAPGSRLFCLSSQWAANLSSLNEIEKSLGLEKLSKKEDNDILSDMNSLLLGVEKAQEKTKNSVDAVAIAIEVDAKKLHLA